MNQNEYTDARSTVNLAKVEEIRRKNKDILA